MFRHPPLILLYNQLLSYFKNWLCRGYNKLFMQCYQIVQWSCRCIFNLHKGYWTGKVRQSETWRLWIAYYSAQVDLPEGAHTSQPAFTYTYSFLMFNVLCVIGFCEPSLNDERHSPLWEVRNQRKGKFDMYLLSFLPGLVSS